MPKFVAPRKLRPALPTKGGVSLKVRGALDDLIHADPQQRQKLLQPTAEQFTDRQNFWKTQDSEGKLLALSSGAIFSTLTIRTPTRLAEHVMHKFMQTYPTLKSRTNLDVGVLTNRLNGWKQEAPGNMMHPKKAGYIAQQGILLREYPSIIEQSGVKLRQTIADGFDGLGYPKAGFAQSLATGDPVPSVFDTHNAAAMGLPKEYASLPKSQASRITSALENLVTKETKTPAGIATWYAWGEGVLGEPAPHNQYMTDLGVYRI